MTERGNARSSLQTLNRAAVYGLFLKLKRRYLYSKGNRDERCYEKKNAFSRKFAYIVFCSTIYFIKKNNQLALRFIVNLAN